VGQNWYQSTAIVLVLGRWTFFLAPIVIALESVQHIMVWR
jgi:hypothetical protein